MDYILILRGQGRLLKKEVLRRVIVDFVDKKLFVSDSHVQFSRSKAWMSSLFLGIAVFMTVFVWLIIPDILMRVLWIKIFVISVGLIFWGLILWTVISFKTTGLDYFFDKNGVLFGDVYNEDRRTHLPWNAISHVEVSMEPRVEKGSSSPRIYFYLNSDMLTDSQKKIFRKSYYQGRGFEMKFSDSFEYNMLVMDKLSKMKEKSINKGL